MQIGIATNLARTTAWAALGAGLILVLPEAAHAASEAGAAKGAFPPFDSKTYPGQLFWLALTFGTLYWLMSRIALPRVGEILAERSATLSRDLNEANAAQAKAQESAAAYEEALASARSRAQAIAQGARAESARQSDERRKAVEADLAAKAVQAEASITAAKAKAMENVRSLGSETAAAIVAKLTGIEPNAAEAAKAVDSVLAR
ncbi:F0F1 ATP synthase subunit B' [Bosea sp. TWI1241]|jgi:F-type H+-transporting ATPase subunit b|uniref:F0F1 ATP synthase subunit B family protein n=1 Tax=Bosea sp. TWI1241 TaxID=3148904 RepID=UPI003208DB23